MPNDLSQARDLIQKCLKEKNPYLELGRCGITDLDELPELFECTHLETLILSNEWWDSEEGTWIRSKNDGAYNKLSQLPEELDQLTNLKKLKASGQNRVNEWGITDLEPLRTLTNLTALDLRNNEIAALKHLDSLTALTELNLSDNQITELKNLNSLTALTRLYLGNNQITEIKNLDSLAALTELNISKKPSKTINLI